MNAMGMLAEARYPVAAGADAGRFSLPILPQAGDGASGQSQLSQNPHRFRRSTPCTRKWRCPPLIVPQRHRARAVSA